ncbi:MAG: YCF48-related protein [candidate division Zixibacteria bacterium]|nr:YCF48-related protein [candidate division Zixibacteria bacterium]MDH3936163.1 YCF48-related protein [candidate division Zixibacteria bacterium]MDH4032985.1 YCF48-related protein [candidate division Zixibacteria bacterium]
MAHNVYTARAALIGSVMALLLTVLNCTEDKFIDPVCEGCFRFHVTHPNSGTQEILRDVFFADSANGWTVGNDGIVLHSDDGGVTWSAQHQGAGGRLWGVHFPTSDFGYVVGEDDTLLRTGDGGDSWTARSTAGFDLTAVYMDDQGRAFAVGDHVVLKANNSIPSWQVYQDIDNVLPFLYGVTFVDPNKGWAVGSGDNRIINTTDAGAHWFPQSNPATQPLLDVSFVDGSHGWAVGVGGTVVYTADGGATWTKQTIGTSRVLHGVDFWNVENGAVVGDSGVVFTTTDGGETWEQRLSGNDNDLLSVSYADAHTLVVCGVNGTLLRFTYSWEECCEE